MCVVLHSTALHSYPLCAVLLCLAQDCTPCSTGRCWLCGTPLTVLIALHRFARAVPHGKRQLCRTALYVLCPTSL